MKKGYVFSKLENGQIHQEEIVVDDIDALIQNENNKNAYKYLTDKYAVSYFEVNWLINKILLINPINHFIERDLEGIIIHAKENNKSIKDSFDYITEFNSDILHL